MDRVCSPAGMMGELVEDRADIAAFPLTLTLDRSQAVDLSYSFMNGGIGILVSCRPHMFQFQSWQGSWSASSARMLTDASTARCLLEGVC